jgi:predicted ATP-grasp superfamily ATP-dependent carboligase
MTLQTLPQQLLMTAREQPGGIILAGTLSQPEVMALEEAGIATLALWAAVPHYVHTSPSPKATLALVAELERLLGVNFSHGDLADQAFAWERGIDEIAENDEEMSGYIEQLEASRDEVDSEAASGEAIARELEKFLQSEQRPPDA